MIDETVLMTIGLMALSIYATRLGGLLLASRLRPTGRLAAWLRALPGALLVAIVAPPIVNGGPGSLAATLVTALVAWRTGSPLAAMVVGVAAIALARASGHAGR